MDPISDNSKKPYYEMHCILLNPGQDRSVVAARRRRAAAPPQKILAAPRFGGL